MTDRWSLGGRIRGERGRQMARASAERQGSSRRLLVSKKNYHVQLRVARLASHCLCTVYSTLFPSDVRCIHARACIVIRPCHARIGLHFTRLDSPVPLGSARHVCLTTSTCLPPSFSCFAVKDHRLPEAVSRRHGNFPPPASVTTSNAIPVVACQAVHLGIRTWNSAISSPLRFSGPWPPIRHCAYQQQQKNCGQDPSPSIATGRPPSRRPAPQTESSHDESTKGE